MWLVVLILIVAAFYLFALALFRSASVADDYMEKWRDENGREK